MVNYSCPRCGFSNNIKTKYIQHLKRKYVCEPILSKDDLSEEYLKYDIKGKKLDISKENINLEKNSVDHQNIPIISKFYPQKESNIPILSNIYPQKITDISKKKITDNTECKYCNKILSSYKNLHRHLKTCKEKIKDDQCRNNMMELVNKLNDQLEKKDKLLEKQSKQIDELIKKAGITQNIQNNIQNTNNIKILAFKNTDISHLTDKDFMYCLNRSNMCVPNLIKKIHFNPKKPENHNVYISNIKNKYAMVYDGNKWNLSNQNETIEDLIDTNEIYLEQKLEEWIENGSEYPEIMKKFNRYLEKKEKDDVLNAIKEEIKLILFNNRKIISIENNIV